MVTKYVFNLQSQDNQRNLPSKIIIVQKGGVRSRMPCTVTLGASTIAEWITADGPS